MSIFDAVVKATAKTKPKPKISKKPVVFPKKAASYTKAIQKATEKTHAPVPTRAPARSAPAATRPPAGGGKGKSTPPPAPKKASTADRARDTERALALLGPVKPVGPFHGTGGHVADRDQKDPKKKSGLDLNPLHAAGDVGNLLASLNLGGGGSALDRHTTAVVRQESGDKVALRLDKSPVLKTVQQLTRVQSASAGAALAGASGKNPVKGAVEGFKSNDKSFVQVAEKLGLHGATAEAAGLAGDIFLDPTTYLRLGFKPIEVDAAVAGARQATKVETRTLKRAAAKVQKGHMTPAQLEALQAGARGRIEKAGKQAAARARAKRTVAGLGPATGDRRGLQVQGRTVATVPRAVTKGGRRVQQSPAVNEILTKLNPKAVPVGMTRAKQQMLREDERTGRAIAARVERDGHLLARLAQDAVEGGLESYKRIVDHIEAGTIDKLADPRELAVASKMRDYFHSVRDAYAEYGVKVDLVGTINSSRQLDDIVKAADKRARKLQANREVPEADAKAARAIVADLKVLRDKVVEDGGEAAFLARADTLAATGGKKLGQLTEAATARAATQTPPVDYVPRQLQSFLDDLLKNDNGRAAQQFNEGVTNQAAPGSMKQRELHRGRLDEFDNRDIYSADVPLLTALYGSKAGRKLGSLHFYNAVMRREAVPLSERGLAEGLVPWRLEGTFYVEVPAKDAADLLAGGRPSGVVMLDPAISKQLRPVLSSGDPSVVMANLDKTIRAWKMGNTITRPGFFVNTALGNAWQLYLRDALNPGDLRAGFTAAAVSVAEVRNASKLGGRPIANFVQRHLSDLTVPVDGRQMSMSELVGEALDNGTIRVGSRLQDPTEISAVRQAELNTKQGGIVSRLPGSRDRKLRPLEGVGAIAEAMDDFGKLTLYARARQQGMGPQRATEHAFTGFIDYGDLTSGERKVMRRLMPFYVFTARNLPLQIKGVFERPGKLANFEKTRQALEAWTGVDQQDPGQRLVPSDQDRLPFVFPGLTSGGRQIYVDARLPVTDLARPANIIAGLIDTLHGNGTDALSRGAQRYLGDLSPAIKGPVELALNQRFDYDRPISAPDVTTRAAPTLAPLLKALGISEQHRDKRTGDMVDTAPSTLDYALRLAGGSPASALLNIGKDDSGVSGVTGNTTALGSYLLGIGLRAPRKDDVTRTQGGALKAKLLAARDGEKNDHGKTRRYYELSDQIDDLSAIVTRAKARIGYPDSKAQTAKLDTADLLARIRGKVTLTPAERVQRDADQKIKDRLDGKAGSGPVDSGAPAALRGPSLVETLVGLADAAKTPTRTTRTPVVARPVSTATAKLPEADDFRGRLKFLRTLPPGLDRDGYATQLQDDIARHTRYLKANPPKTVVTSGAFDAQGRPPDPSTYKVTVGGKPAPAGIPKAPSGGSYNRGSGGDAALRKEARAAAEAEGLNPDYFEAQINQESGFRLGQTSTAGAQGVAQIMPDTARAWGVDPNDAKAALKVAAREMKKYVDKYGEEGALRAYNAGEGGMDKGYAETLDYVRKIMGAATGAAPSASPAGMSTSAPMDSAGAASAGTMPAAPGRSPTTPSTTGSPATGNPATDQLKALLEKMTADREKQDADEAQAQMRQSVGNYLAKQGNTTLAGAVAGTAAASISDLLKILAAPRRKRYDN